MAVNIKLKRSAQSGKIPTTSSLELGEIALNTFDGRAFMKIQNNVTTSVVEFATTAGSGSSVVSASYALTASFASYAANAGNALTANFATSASYSLNSTSASYAQTSSYAGNFNVSGNLAVGGAITAQTLHVQTITSSVIYSSGSNIFGDSTADTQTLNGTVSVSGSFNVTGSATINNLTGSLFGTASWALNAISSSYANNATTASYALNSELLDGLDSTVFTLTSSFNSFTSSYYTDSASFNNRINSLTESVFTHVVTNNGASNYIIDGVTKPILSFVPGATYRFNTSGVVGTHPFKFSTSPNGPTEYTTGVTSGSNYIQIEVNYDTPTLLYYYCTIHSGMGNEIDILRINTLNTGSFSGSFIGTFTGSFSGSLNNLQGSATYIPFFSSSQVLANSTMYQVGTASIAINETNITTANPEALYVFQTHPTSINVVTGKGNLNHYLQNNIQNTNQGVSASSDVVATANNGNEDSFYIDMGINSENYNLGFVGGANDAYVYAIANNLHIGSAATGSQHLGFFVGGTDVEVNNKLQLNPNNQHKMSGSLDISGSLTVRNGITGSLFGTASWALNAISSSYTNNATSASYAANATSASYASDSTSASYALNATTASYASASTSASYAANATTASYALDATSASYAANSTTASYALNTTSASYAFNATSASYAVTAAYASNVPATASYAISASHADTASYVNPLTQSVQISGSLGVTGSVSITGSGTVLSANVDTIVFTGSFAQSGSVTVNGDITSTGTITAQTLYVQTITSSVDFVTGSTHFGTKITDTHQFTGSVTISGSLAVNGSNVILTSQTSSMSVLSSSYALTASYSNNSTSASYALTASYVENAQTASFVQNAISASYASGSTSASYAANATSASYANNATSASYALNATSASYASDATTASYALNTTSASYAANATSASYSNNATSASYAANTTSASYALTSSYVENAQTASYVLNAISASYASGSTSASYSLVATSASYASSSTSASYAANATSASYANNATSASYSLVATSASYASSSTSASYSNNSTSASYALTASFALNGGGGGLSALYIQDEGSTQGTASYIDFTGAGVTATVTNGTASIVIPGGGGGSAVQGASVTFSQPTASTTWSINHAINSRTPVVEVYDSNYNVIIPTGIYNPAVFQTEIYFQVAQSGYAIISTGGVLSVSGSNAILNQATASTTWSFSHELNNLYPVFTIFDSNDDVIIPQRIHVVDTSSALIYFSSPRTGTAVASIAGNQTFASSSLSSSYAATASYVVNALTASFVTLAQSASYVLNAVSSSYASTASFVTLAQTASFVTTAQTASFVQNAQTASFVTTAQTASFVQNAQTASYVENAQTASFVQNAQTASFVTTAQTASYILQAVSASYASSSTNAVIAATASSADSFLVRGTLTAQTLVVQTVTSSIVYSSGSNIFGNDLTNTQILTGSVTVTGSLAVNNSNVILTNQTSSMSVATASFVANAQTASYILNAISASYASSSTNADTASFVTLAQTASFVTTAQTASFVQNAQTASYVENAQTASFVTTAQTASYVLNAISASYASSSTNADTASFVTLAQTASFVTTAQTASFVTLAQTASFVTTAQTASYVLNAISSSYASSSTSASYASNATSASYSSNSTSASYALTASFALNGGGGGISAIYIADEGTLQGTASYFDFTGAGVTATVSAGTASINITGGGGGGTSGLSTFFTQSVAAVTWSFTHNLNTRTPLVQVYDSGYNQITPQYVSASNGSTVEIGFGIATAGYAVASTGGTLYVTGSNVILDQSVAAATWSFTHNLNTQYPVFQVFNSSNEVIIPERIVAVDTASALIYFPTNVSGKAVASLGGLSGSFTASYALNTNTASYALTSSYSLSGTGFPYSGSAVITGSFLVSQSFVDFSRASYVTGSFTGSLLGTASFATTASYATFALTASTAPGYTVQFSQSSAAATWSFTHNMNTRNPIVQVYDTNYKQIIPNDIVGVDVNTAEIRFDYAQAGYAVMSNGGGLYITGSTSELIQSSGATTWSFTHNLNSKYVNFTVYDSNDFVIIPANIKAIDVNSAELYFATSQTGRAVAQFSGINGAPNATTASYALTASYASTFKIDQSLLDYASVNSSVVGSNNLFTQATGSFTSAFFQYTVSSGSNARSGQVMSVWNGSTVSFTDVATTDIGSTNDVTGSVVIVSGDVEFNIQTNSSGWRIKSTATFM